MDMDKIRATAYAKVNLGLEVIGKRNDGYHNLVTIFQNVNLCDNLTFCNASSLELTCNYPELANDKNLVMRAAKLMRRESGANKGAHMHIEKKIPISGGLGGGSVDAAAALISLNKIWDMRLDGDKLKEIALKIGADVPFFLKGGTAFATGKGENLENIPTPKLGIVVIFPNQSIENKTEKVYSLLTADDWSDGKRTKGFKRKLLQGVLDLDLLTNSFERVSKNIFQGVNRVFDVVKEYGGFPLLCGAGPTVISVHKDMADAERVSEYVKKAGFFCKCVSTISAPAVKIEK